MPDLTPGTPEPEEELHRTILGEDPVYSADEVAVAAGIGLDETRRLWRALGFPESGDEAAYTPSDLRALGTLVEGIRAGLFDLDLAVNITRAVGQNMARLADWEVAAMVNRIDELELGADATGTRAGSARRFLEHFGQPFEELLIYAWRRHLAAAVARIEALGADEEDLHTTTLSVGFADIVSFTALSNQLTEERIGDLVELFESRCADVVAIQRGRVIKSIGDSVLFVNDDPVRAYDTAEGIINVIGRDQRMPDVRVGLATGSVVMRLGDVFGPPVNMAARLTAVARRNRIIIDATTAELLPSDQFETRRLPGRPVRGFGIVEPLAVRRH
ncbi:adenylate/guanylate cyclase domain-containing protein [Nocardioides abyssi]|uniref:Adenylate/guanylate cyclase domain-containing protein n=1 Tax=Nocardioides abyssi TaxID=3058370 RepID=A0ABT8EVV8_9ACTN|nr:adenylate/guanylate cyclase domain-containing protein [Nocardioides abyssi]MDN4162313.1 adenylate/guanylate cyclase domain-containing protein [Nocardioides abyssi]